ncbi:MAG: aminotransferase class III-fold pyridoxal phosphate-dependent enzyme [Saccharofermentanales bacterium]
MESFKLSLRQLLGDAYLDSVIAGASVLYGMDAVAARDIADDEVDFIPDSHIRKMERLLDKVGTRVIPAMNTSQPGAATDAFKAASHLSASPVGGIGYIRLGEDGRLYLMAKSEHYHTPLGHNFPGYKLIDNARSLGITNATHNNTRGYITRLLERELVRTANGLGRNDEMAIDGIIASKQPHVLNRVINLETGSIACEAGIKMMLARFYKLDANFETPEYAGRIPVFFVMADNEGGGKANYHGTSVIAQTMRDLWPGFYDKIENAGIYKVCPVNINDFEDFKAKFEQFDKPPYKVAGFTHEIIMMNYGGIRLDEDFLKKAYKLCHDNDTPVMCDEIQSCMWYPGMYLFRLYGLDPDFVVIGKGFPGGQYAASRIITTFEMDSLNQFGALVTNGQEELASLAYLITMEFAQRNASHIDETGRYYEMRLKALSDKYAAIIDRVEGKGHLSSIFFYTADDVLMFTRILTERCIDISSQTYKSKCPPAALTKPPVIATETMIDFLIGRMDEALGEVAAKQMRGDQT